MTSRDASLGRFLALVLRHDPGRIGLTLDGHGWADVDELLAGASAHGVRLDEDVLRRVVTNDDKGRYVLDE